jgi:2-polyprenyl-3-methyl-5-hydroxy-6-metoxy-1,4-benzoquinol methylase/glycosyltransferase involved in cell wall biosynthesis
LFALIAALGLFCGDAVNYVIQCMGMPFNGETIKNQSLGGSETAAYYLGRELAERGHRVVMFTNSQEEGVYDGVTYCFNGQPTQAAPLGDRFTHFASHTPHDVLVIQRHPLAFHKDYASQVNVHQMHDLALRRSAGAINAGGARVDLVTGVSEFHIRQMKEVYGLHDRVLRAVPNGVDLSLYVPRPFNPGHPVNLAIHDGEFPLLYQSRPERGLEHLLRPDGIMDRLAKAGSKARLFYCAYANTVAEQQAYYGYLDECAARLPNVTNLGALTKDELAQVQMLCSLLVYPTEFEEVSCITAMEAMAANLPMLSSEHGALPETCKDSGSVLLPLKDGIADEDAFVTNIQWYELHSEELQALRHKQAVASETKSWAHAVDIFEEQIAEVFARRSSSPARMARHLIEHSDISALREMNEASAGQGPINAIQDQALGETVEMYAFARTAEATAAHYEKWEGMNCDRMAREGLNPDVERRNVMASTRFRGITHLLAKAVGERAEGGLKTRVLEFGCAHGHITLAMAEQFPNVKFFGIDFMQRSVDLARKTAFERGLHNVEFFCGSLDDLAQYGEFDVVIAPEVVEHIWDYRGALKKLLAAATPTGTLIVTTPHGRWEWSGRHWWHKGREHLHHFERQDIVELFSEFQTEILQAPGGIDPAGAAMGSWVYAATKSAGAELGHIDYARKLRTTAPRDTVSLCMIVRDAQETIGRALRSVVEYVDEVCIAVDRTTTDRTRERIADVSKDFPHVVFSVFDGDSPLEIGFDEARNVTVSRSCGDWILWMDADEEINGAQNLFRLLRPGAFDGYAVAQHHMSQLPAERISTDWPTRLFRRDSGARFFGVVHEHPETQIGKAIPHTFQVSDIAFIHYGYSDEIARRGRFHRNFPLLQKDLQKHPDRVLNKFLYVRDLAQAIAFEGEQTGAVSDGMRSNAQTVISLFDKLIDDNPMLRMTLDAVPYYSTAVAAIGSGFHAKIAITTKKDEMPGISATAQVEGFFHSRETYSRLLARIAKETTVNYEGKYV